MDFPFYYDYLFLVCNGWWLHYYVWLFPFVIVFTDILILLTPKRGRHLFFRRKTILVFMIFVICINFFQEFLSWKPSECQTGWIQPLLGLIWIQQFCRCYRQTALVGENSLFSWSLCTCLFHIPTHCCQDLLQYVTHKNKLQSADEKNVPFFNQTQHEISNNVQPSKFLKICTCTASSKILAYMGKI